MDENETNNDSLSLSSYESDNEIQCKNIAPKLAKAINVPTEIEEKNLNTDWKPPDTYGLSNSRPIIQQYYFKDGLQNLRSSFNYLNNIHDDIRNYRKLEDYQLNYIKNLDNEEKDQIIKLYNEVLDTLIKNFS
jgi:hypothetical protein